MRTLTLALFLGAALGCATSPAPAPAPAMAGHHGGHHPQGPVVKPGEATLGDTTVCPVSGETFVVDKDSPHAEYQGKTYYFCCSDCGGDFQRDPAKFLSKL